MSGHDSQDGGVNIVPPSDRLSTLPVQSPGAFTLSSAAQGTEHKVHIFRSTIGSNSDREQLTHRKILDIIDEIGEREGTAADAASELSVRDVCKVDPQFSTLLDPKVDVRGQVVLVNLGPQRLGALIMKTEVILLATESTVDFARSVQRRLQRLLNVKAEPGARGSQADLPESPAAPKSPFQATTLEAILLSASLELQGKIDTLVVKVNQEVSLVHEASLFEDASEGAAWIVGARELKNRINGLAGTARGLDKALTETLDEDDEEVLQVLQRSVEESAMGTSEGGRRRNRDAAAH